ncbi:SslE/AcfD family lipoprotein zinc metalloprotease [Photobacterium damselae]|uniref:SslE/AcfD family lipoprotein zinc metalloprotease n=1 Tax=Photobacterium damselae TaxID=38293 RepID=UPI001F0B212D|nr:SslE/AcfD family lipoprotein zinc metalloprotease [Photobacterium damselae]
MKTSKTILAIVIPSILFSLTGCDDNESHFSGQFVDSPVEGLSYACANGDSGFTGADGIFNLTGNTVCSFKLNDLVLGISSVSEAASIITPYNLSTNQTQVTNVAALLQNLDTDRNANNGITLPIISKSIPEEILKAKNDAQFKKLLQEVVSTDHYITLNEAIKHLNKTISTLPQGTIDNSNIIAPDSDSVNDQNNPDITDKPSPDEETSKPDVPSIPDNGNQNKPEDDTSKPDIPSIPDNGDQNKPEDDTSKPDIPSVPDNGDQNKPEDDTSKPATPINAIPTLSKVDLGEIIADKDFSYQVQAQDSDGDLLTYTLVNNPNWLKIDSNSGLMSGKPTEQDLEPVTFTLVVSDGHGSVSQKITIDVIKMLPPTDLEPALQRHTGEVFLSGLKLKGDISCNGTELDTNGNFVFWDKEPINCQFGAIDLFTENGLEPKPFTQSEETINQFDVKKYLNKDAVDNTVKLFKKIDKCKEDDKTICLDAVDSYDIANLYNSTDTNAVNKFINPTSIDETEEIGKAPSSHVDIALKPEVTVTETDLSKPFVSASAEEAYEYKPVKVEITESSLTDDNSIPLAGINYYSPSSRGITDANGKFEYVWGEKVTFGIDTFEFGTVKGNQVSYKLSDVTDSPLIKQNIQNLIQRYGKHNSDTITFDQNVHKTFALYPNAINEIINLSLPNGAKIGNTDFKLPNEFENQFQSGMAKDIDTALKQPVSYFYSEQAHNIGDNANSINATLKRLYTNVGQFHIFHDIGSFYGASGYARLMRNLNISNSAYPILMPRHDSNYWLPFDKKQAWTRELKPHIADAKTIDANSNVTMKPVPKVSKENATFNLPGITLGEIGKGKVVFMGNIHYPIVLSCPDSYWADKSLGISNTTCDYKVKNADGSKADPKKSKLYDNGAMSNFFKNLFTLMAPTYNKAKSNIVIGTNIVKTPKYDHGHTSWLPDYNFFIDNSYNVTLNQLSEGGYSSLDPKTTPILLLRSFEATRLGKWDGSYEDRSDVKKPILTDSDVTDLIDYVNNGGNIIFFDAISEINPEPIAKLADSAGVSLGGGNVAEGTTTQSYCGSSYYCHGSGVAPNIHTVTEKDLVVYERFETKNEEESKIKIKEDGTVDWPPLNKMPKLEVAKYDLSYMPFTMDAKPETRYAFFQVSNENEKKAAIEEIKAAFPGVEECKNDYEYEVNCIEYRKGHGIPANGSYGRTIFERYQMNNDVIDSMVQAANLGSDLDKLYNHELYYRTEGKEGKRLSLTELNQTYDNVSVWLWNDEPYRYDDKGDGKDELGFKVAVEYLNCYTNNKHEGNSSCTENKKSSLKKHNFILDDGQLNPSYPLNYQEKPLTRIMLGRSYWDLDIKVDTSKYPATVSATPSSDSVTITTMTNPVTGTASNMQSTGLWAPQHQKVSVSGGVKATITVALVDDLTGRKQHEVALNRPPRVQKSFQYDGTSLEFTAPYGGLIYIKPDSSANQDEATFTFSDVVKAPFWKNGKWVHSQTNNVPLAEIDTGSVIYTTPVKNVSTLSNEQMKTFVEDMNFFADSASDFYGRDEITATGEHRRFTYDDLLNHRHRFVNDVQISIGGAHSGYPVMSTTYNKDATNIPTTPRNDWLLWHEIGHNLAAAPFNIAGGTEVTNNILALYMQEHRAAPNNRMDRVENDLRKIPLLINRDGNHLWSHGDAGIRLAMFAQLKIWAKDHFKIEDWYENGSKLSIYDADQGWNMFKLMHRKARGDVIGDDKHGNGKNYCSSTDTGLSGGDLLMVCSSYVSGYDLSSFFKQWNPAETMNELPNGTKLYSGSIRDGFNVLKEIKNLKQPTNKPEDIISL